MCFRPQASYEGGLQSKQELQQQQQQLRGEGVPQGEATPKKSGTTASAAGAGQLVQRQEQLDILQGLLVRVEQ